MAKLATGWAAHLFYWVYPGVMVAMMAILIGYIYNQFTGKDISPIGLTVIAVAFAAITGYIAYRGVTGSTTTAIWVNVIQWFALLMFSALAIWYRIVNPEHVRPPVEFQRGLGCHPAALAERGAGPIDPGDPDPGRFRKLHGPGGGNQEAREEHPPGHHHLADRPGITGRT